MKNAFSIDLEFWHSGEPYRNYLPETVEEDIEISIFPLLKLLEKYDTFATFFVLGELAEKYPDLIKIIDEYGHEISSHGYSHNRLHILNKVTFEEELKKSIKILKSITGNTPLGFRAPSFSIDNSTKWAFEILIKYGFKYDSSVFPFKARLYGVPDAPLMPYKPALNDITKIDDTNNIIEFPLSIVKIGRNIPISGGYYFRLLPFWFIKLSINKINKNRPYIFYIHSWETFSKTPRLNIPFPQNFFAYYGINSTLRKIEKLLKEFKFAPIKEVLQL